MGYYLQIGDLILADGSADSSGYSLTGHPSFPEPDPDGYGSHRPAVRSFTVRCTGTTASAAHNKATLLRRECVRDNYLRFKHNGSASDYLECRIREARCVESEYAPGIRDAFGVTLGVTLETDPYWLGAWSASASASASVTTPADHFDVSGGEVVGEVDALLDVRIISNGTFSALALGVMPDPSASYLYTADFSGTALTNALSGSAYLKTSPATDYINSESIVGLNLTDSHQSRGRYLLLARVSACATSYATVYLRGRADTSGYLISSSVYSDGAASVPLTASALTVYDLGIVNVPAGAVPTGITCNTNVGVMMWQAEASAGVYFDYLQLIPVDYAAVIYRPLTPDASGEGFYWSSDDDIPYIADTDGTGFAVLSETEIRRPLRVKPGVTNRVIVGVVPSAGAAVAGAAMLSYRIRPRYLTAAS